MIVSTQLPLDLPASFSDDAYAYGARASGEAHGVVLTRRHVAEFMLDLAGYSADRDLTTLRLLEPACGVGAFLVPAVERLLASAKRASRDVASLHGAIRAFDIDDAHVVASREAVRATLKAHGVSEGVAHDLASRWVTRGDFLLAPMSSDIDVVIGNPPYVRIEQVAPLLQAEYRRRYSTLFDRADLYVAFIERSLTLLGPGGVLCFVCADRWVLNRYGAPLRAMINASFRVNWYIDLHSASPFESEVIAYPSIFSLSPGRGGPVLVGRMRSASPEECDEFRAAWRAEGASTVDVESYHSWFEGDAPWVLSSSEHLAVLRHLESSNHPLEADGQTRVGIGVATGCDEVFVVGESTDIEPDRLVPLAMRADIHEGRVHDSGRRVINTFSDEGGVVDLAKYPRLARHLRAHGAKVRQRHVARRNPAAWYRTIDRVYPALVATPKLLIPDIAGSNEVAYDPGRFHPHHNLYFVTSTAWDLEVLGALLSSRVALFFVWSYAVKMRGGYLRFQAQYLRRIHVPRPSCIPVEVNDGLRDAFRRRDFRAIDALALRAFNLPSLPDFDFVDTRR